MNNTTQTAFDFSWTLIVEAASDTGPPPTAPADDFERVNHELATLAGTEDQQCEIHVDL